MSSPPSGHSPGQESSHSRSALDLSNLDVSNQRELHKLIISIRATTRRFRLLLAVCDNQFFQDRLISAYEAQLRADGMTTLQVELDTERPSLRATLENLVTQTPFPQTNEPTVVTVLNASRLTSVQRTDQKGEKSGREQLFFSLQWTREALRQFDFPIVLWLSDHMATQLAQRAPDFWSWRDSVFEFEDHTKPSIMTAEQHPSQQVDNAVTNRAVSKQENASLLSTEELQQQISAIKVSSPGSPLLVTLYNTLGNYYEQEANYSSALSAFEQALIVAEENHDNFAQARILHNKGKVLTTLSQYTGARSAYDTAIENWEIVIEKEPNNVKILSGKGTSLQRLADLQAALSQHQQAQQTYEASITAFDATLKRSPDYVQALNNKGLSLQRLADLQAALSQHQQAQQTYEASITAIDAALNQNPKE